MRPHQPLNCLTQACLLQLSCVLRRNMCAVLPGSYGKVHAEGHCIFQDLLSRLRGLPENWPFRSPCSAMTTGSLEAMLTRLRLQKGLGLPLCGLLMRRFLQTCSSDAMRLRGSCTEARNNCELPCYRAFAPESCEATV